MARQSRDGVKVTPETAAMMTLAAKHLNVTVAQMTERACLGLLKHEARQLFERELNEVNRKATENLQPTVHRHEFEARWSPPAWKP